MSCLSLQAKADTLTRAKLIRIDRIENQPALKECVKILHSHVFPVSYQPKFFDVIYEHSYHGMNLVSLFNGILVGAICARLEFDPQGKRDASAGNTHDAHTDSETLLKSLAAMSLDGQKSAPAESTLTVRCYIMTLGVLPRYRRLGLASMLLRQSMENLRALVARKNAEVEKTPKVGAAREKIRVTEVMLHVQVNNESAINFYKNHGFAVKERVTDYYTAVEPRDAFLLAKDFNAFSENENQAE